MTSREWVLQPGDLAARRADPGMLLVDVCKPEVYAAGHVPGAVHVDYANLVRAEPPVGGLLPEPDALAALSRSIGLTRDRLVVAYDDEGSGRAARLLWTLHALGHDRLALLDGGLGAWSASGGVLQRDAVVNEAADGPVKAEVSRGVADSEWIVRRLGDRDLVLLDTRTPAEFSGQDRRAARGGHIPGAVNVDWTLSMRPDPYRSLRPRDELLRLYEDAGVRRDAEIVAYCQTHHRSSHTFWVLKYLGYERVRGYPGAWSQWGNREDLPVES